MRLIRKILFSGHIWVEILPYPGGYLSSCSSKQHLNLSESTFMCYIVGNFRRRMYVVVFCLLRGKLHIRYWRDNDGPASRQSVPISEIVVQIGIFFFVRIIADPLFVIYFNGKDVYNCRSWVQGKSTSS